MDVGKEGKEMERGKEGENEGGRKEEVRRKEVRKGGMKGGTDRG